MTHFQSFPPSPDLQPLVKSFWTLSGSEGAPQTYRYIPDCNPEWVFNLNNVIPIRYKGEEEARALTAHSIGQFGGFLEMTEPGIAYSFFAIKFHPWSAHQLWEGSMKDYTDTLVDLQVDGANWVKELADRLQECHSTTDRIVLVEKYLRKNISCEGLPLLSHCYQSLQSNPFGATTERLEQVSNLSRRRIEQLFSEKIGLTPKRIHRIHRIRQTIDYMRGQPNESMTEIAHRFHFFDQSHFNREVRHFTGFVPRQLRQHLNPDPEILNLLVS